MARKKASTPPKNDFAPEEDLDISAFTSEPVITGECISSFSFDDDSINENTPIADKQNTINIDNSPKAATGTINFNISSTDEQNTKNHASSNNIAASNTKNKLNNNTAISNNQSTSNKNNILDDNRKAPIVNGMAPPIDGEYLNVKRTYCLELLQSEKLMNLKVFTLK